MAAYECQNFIDGQILTAECLNKIEKALEGACNKKVTSAYIDKNGELKIIFADKTELDCGCVGDAAGVYVGTDTPPENANVWINPEGEPANTESWEFDLDDGSTDTKKVVVVDSDEATANGRLAILRTKDENGNWIEIPALIGSKGDKGDKGDQGIQGVQGAKGEKGDAGEKGEQGEKGSKGDKGDSITISSITKSDKDGGSNVLVFSDGNIFTVKNGSKGDKGDKGEQGIQGIQGVQGIQGEHGAQGVQGVQGTQGEKGDKGDKGESGVTTPINGFFTLSVDSNGDLYIHTADESNAPDFEYDEATGNIYFVTEE